MDKQEKATLRKGFHGNASRKIDFLSINPSPLIKMSAKKPEDFFRI
jgi:hypothetical protein